MKKNLLPWRLTSIVAGLLAAASLALADNEVWIGNPGVTATTNWSDTSNWSGTSHNPNNNTVFFGSNGQTLVGTVDNVVDTSTNCYALNFTNASTTHTTLIQPGQTLTIDGNYAGPALNLNPQGQAVVTNTITGANGTVLITGSSAGGVFVAITNSSVANLAPLLDMSGLGTFIINSADSGAQLQVGNGANRSDGVLNLAMTNYIALPASGTGNSAALIVGNNTSNNGSSPGGQLNLGQTNTILADNIGVGLSKQTVATLRFNPAFTNDNANPVVYFRGYSGTAVKNWAIGDGEVQSGTSVGGSGTVDLRNGTVNAVVTTMWLGKVSPVSVTAPASSGTFSFSAGTVSVVTLTNGMMTTSVTNETASGTINVTGSGALLSVNTMVMAVYTNNPGSSTGTLNITNGTVAVGSLSVGAVTAGSGSSTSTINVSNGTLIVTNAAGTTAAPLTALNLTGGTVQLSVNGAANATNIVAKSVGTNGGPTTIIIGSVANVGSTTTLPLISYTGTDPYGNLALQIPLPNGFSGTLMDNSANNRIDLQVSPPVAAASLVWVGATNSVLNGNWDDVTSNWLDAATMTIPKAYMDLDAVLFNDTASDNVVTLTTNLAPISILVSNNALNYTFTGSGKISGATSLIKSGTGSLTLAETGGDSFNGGIIVSNGTLVLDNAASGILGGLNLVSGTVQVGNSDGNGNLPGGGIVDNGSLVFMRADTLTVSTPISGAGSVTQNGADTLTLSGANSYAGGLLVNAGTLRLGSGTAQGTGAIIVTNTGTLVLGATNLANSITLSGGTLGESASLNPLTNDLYLTAGTTSLIYEADPQNLTPGDASEMAWSNTLHGSGSFLVATVTNDASADSGNGFRLRGITPTTFSGTITFSNNVKGEIQTTVTTPFSPAGTATIQLLCGTYLGNNSTSNNLTSPGYTEFNIRDNSAGNCTFGNNVTVLGTGFTTLDPLGTAPAGSTLTMGNLTIGNGQVLGVYLSAAPAHVIVFPTVTLTGGTATLSPKTPGFGATSSVGSDLSLGNISEMSPSSLVLNGLRTNYFTGNNTYSGSTTVSNGVLVLNSSGTAIPGYLAIAGGMVSLSASDQIADSATVNISSGALALNAYSNTVGPVILTGGGAIIGTSGTLSGASYDFQNGSVSANLAGAGSVLTKSTSSTVTLSGTNTYTGNTVISNGVLALAGSSSISGSSNIILYAGGMLDVSGTTSTSALGTNQTLISGSGSPGTVAGNFNLTAGALALSYVNGTPALYVTNGAFALNNNPVSVTVSGAPLPAGSYLLVATDTSGVVGGSVSASTLTLNGAGSSAGNGSLQLTNGGLYLVVHTPPVAGTNTYTRNGLNTWKILVSNLLTNATDVEGNALSLAGVGTSTNGITLVITTNSPAYVEYFNTNLVDDQFTYTVADSYGDTSSAVITLVAGSSNGLGGQVSSMAFTGGVASMTFAGIPGYTYDVQVSTNLTDWITVLTTNAPANGVFQFTDDAAPTPDAYYRLMWNGY